MSQIEVGQSLPIIPLISPKCSSTYEDPVNHFVVQPEVTLNYAHLRFQQSFLYI